jgi:hypothetical protein
MARQTIRAKNCWFIPGRAYVSEAEGQYIPGKSLSLKFISEGAKYTVIVKADPDGRWHGQYEVGTADGAVSATLFTAEDESIVFVGHWAESGYDYTWLVHDVELDEEDES